MDRPIRGERWEGESFCRWVVDEWLRETNKRYDGDGRLIRKLHSDGVTVYVGSVDEIEFNTSSQIAKRASY